MPGRPKHFLIAAMVGTAAVFVLSGTAAKAQTSLNASSGEYNIARSAENLISPFKNFIDSLQWTTSINIHAATSTWPVIDVKPTIQDLFSQFNDWFYHLTNIKLSGTVIVILSAVSWILGIGKEIVDWFLGLTKATYTS